MPDIDPAALSRPAGSGSTPVMKSITVSAPAAQKVSKTSQIIPVRIDLEPIYTPLKAAIGPEQWNGYKEAVSLYIQGRLNQAEYSDRVDPILFSGNGDKVHLHNQFLAAILGNLTREMPDPGLAPWVSANDKPAPTVGAKPVTGDAAERKLKGEVMQLPSRDRRRIKELALNDYDPYESLANLFSDHHRVRQPRVPDSLPSAGGLNKTNLDLEIKKRFAQPLAIESGELPDTSSIESRMLPMCYEAGLVNGHANDAPQYLTVATETFIKEFLSTVFSRTRSNGPGDSGSAGFGAGTGWIQSHRYRRQLQKEEAALARGELSRDKSGLLPVEAKSASERPPLNMADLRLALDIGDCGLTTFPIVRKQVTYNYRDGELENYNNYTYMPGYKPSELDGSQQLTNGAAHPDAMDIDEEPSPWEGTTGTDMQALNGVLDSCLAVP
ncbi:transcriptional regulator of RNA polII, SAGA, subunit-domain-containing protein [Xylariomycetidae sp. FL0641]|nr:transcriptional regulator of RNA polII, SAGA, subunit-domain-containing protein [Xylariomycetidae sp. FL0641]